MVFGGESGPILFSYSYFPSYSLLLSHSGPLPQDYSLLQPFFLQRSSYTGTSLLPLPSVQTIKIPSTTETPPSSGQLPHADLASLLGPGSYCYSNRVGFGEEEAPHSYDVRIEEEYRGRDLIVCEDFGFLRK